jgi:hypothetical protein
MASDPGPIEGAPRAGRHLLGVLLRQRRTELGYTHRPAFAVAALPLTGKGNPNTRLLADIEEAYRDDFPEARLRQLARAYLADYESLVDVAHLRAGTLVPASPVPDEPPDWTPPMTDPARIASARTYFDQIQGRLDLLRARGIAEPSGRQLFPDAPADAKTWDGVGARLDIGARVWLIADLRRRADGRAGDSGEGATGS